MAAHPSWFQSSVWQNACWQGEIYWLDGEKKMYFRSLLEMVMLMQGTERWRRSVITQQNTASGAGKTKISNWISDIKVKG